ncbi:hypothetical protein [Halarcobacter sp.]|uniref:hypothetical protein n=1 Tax=Halarcobacter sp. TaxID=2321133 RepID=UPI0029F5A907|nr:hypothetical protein [Halarcobacter sp.]
MKQYTGANVANITKIRQSDVFIGNTITVVGTVTVPTLADGEALKLGTLLRSLDGGLTWDVKPATFDTSADTDDIVYYEGKTYKSTADGNANLPSTLADWENLGDWDANGILYNDITTTSKTTVVVTASAKGKYLQGFDEFLRPIMFKNKLFVK